MSILGYMRTPLCMCKSAKTIPLGINLMALLKKVNKKE